MLNGAEDERVTIAGRLPLWEKLSEAFGPRGIQHFVFMGVVRYLGPCLAPIYAPI